MSSSQLSNVQVIILGADTFYGQSIIREWAKINPAQTRQIHAVVNARNNDAERALKSVGVGRVTLCDYQNESKLAQEIKDCDYVVICPPIGAEYTKQQAETSVQAVTKARAKNVVMLSLVGVDASKTSDAFKNCHRIESLVKQHCDCNVILRVDVPTQFFDFCVPMIHSSGNLHLNAGNGRFAPIDLADVSKVLSHIAKNKSLENNLKGQTCQLTGPSAVDGNAIAQSIRKGANSQKPQGYQNTSRQELERELNRIYQNVGNQQQQQQRGAQGVETRHTTQQQQQQQGKARGQSDIPQTIIEKPSIDGYKQTISAFMDCCDLVQQNALTEVTKDVQRLANSQPTRLEDYFKRESQVYARLI